MPPDPLCISSAEREDRRPQLAVPVEEPDEIRLASAPLRAHHRDRRAPLRRRPPLDPRREEQQRRPPLPCHPLVPPPPRERPHAEPPRRLPRVVAAPVLREEVRCA